MSDIEGIDEHGVQHHYHLRERLDAPAAEKAQSEDSVWSLNPVRWFRRASRPLLQVARPPGTSGSISSPPRSTSLPASIASDLYNDPKEPDMLPTLNVAVDHSRLESLSKESQRLSRLIDKALLQRYLVEAEQTALDNSQAVLFRNTDALLVAHTEALTAQHGFDETETLKLRDERVRKDFRALQTQAERLKELRGGLSRLEYRLKTKAELLRQVIEDRVSNAPDYAGFTVNNESEPSETSSAATETDAESDTPALLEQFYDRKGDINVIQERQEFLEDEYNEAILRREILLDRGDPLESTDETFNHDFEVKRQALVLQLETAIRDIEVLHSACLEAGYATSRLGEVPSAVLDPENASTAVGDPLIGSSIALPTHDTPAAVDDSNFEQVETSSTPEIPEVGMTPNGQATILRWVGDVQATDQDAPLTPGSVGRSFSAASRSSKHRSRGKTADSDSPTSNAGRSSAFKTSPRLAPSQRNLYHDFERQSDDFFDIGRVFLCLWSEPFDVDALQATTQADTDLAIPARRKAERSFEKIRRFVVIRKSLKYCTALSIKTRGGQGVSKSGVIKSEHGIIYTGTTAPTILPGEAPEPDACEQPMLPRPVKVVPDDPTDALVPASRLDYGKAFTVDHTMEVKSFGMVHPDFIEALKSQFREVWTRSLDEHHQERSD